MKWIGENIRDYVSRFRNHTYFEDSITLSTGKSITMDEYTSGTISITKIQDSGTTFNDNDTSLMTAAAIDDRVATLVTAEDLDLTADSGTAAVDLNSQALAITGGTGITTSATGQAVTVNSDAAATHITSLGTLTGLTLGGSKSVTPGDGAMIHLDGGGQTITDSSTSASGTAGKYTHVNIEFPRLAATNASVTTTDAASLYISGAPYAHTNQTITNPWALWVDAGNARFDGSISQTLGDYTLYDAVNDGNPTISLGSAAANRFEIKSVYNSGTQTLCDIDFTTYTASGTAHDGRFNFFVDEVWTGTMNDNGLYIYNGAQIQCDGDGATLTAIDTTTSSTTQGGKLRLRADDGAAMGDGHRLGVIEFSGAEDASNNRTIGARIEAMTDAAWSASENGGRLDFYTTDGNASESLVLTLDSNKLATFAKVVDLYNTTTSSATEGGVLRLISDDGAALGDDHRLGVISFKAAEDSSNNLKSGAKIEAFADAAWSTIENGSRMVFSTNDANNSISTVLTLDSDKLATFTGTVAVAGFKGTGATTVTNILDEDAMGSDSATALATQQSIKAYVDGKYSYAYMTWSASGVSSVDGSDPEWIFPHTSKGIYEEDWNKDENITATSVGTTTFTISKNSAVNGLVIPHAGQCVGFHAHGYNKDSDVTFRTGLFHLEGSTTGTTNNGGVDYGASGNTHECTLRWIANADEAEASGGADGTAADSFQGPCKLVSNTTALTVSAGDVLLPAIMGPDASDEIFVTMTIILKIPVTIAS